MDSKKMTVEKLKNIIEKYVPFDEMRLNAGIYEFGQDNELSIGISFETEENEKKYIYNLFCEGEYINISGYGTKEDPAPKDVLTEMVNEWNNLLSHEKSEVDYLETLVSKGLDKELVQLSVRENTMSAEIGEYWFYFDSDYVDENFKFDSVAKEKLVSKIAEAMMDIKKGINEDEYLYYKAVLEEGIVKDLKNQALEQFKTERDGWGNPVAFVPFGVETMEITYEPEQEVYSALIHNQEGSPVLPYINGESLDAILVEVLKRTTQENFLETNTKKEESQAQNSYSNDDLELIVAGANIAGYMEAEGLIEVESDTKLTSFLVDQLAAYKTGNFDGSFIEVCEEGLKEKFGKICCGLEERMQAAEKEMKGKTLGNVSAKPAIRE